MNALWLVAIVAIVTVGSRIVALVVLPPPTGRLAELVHRLPAPLFAGLAVLSLLNAESGPLDPRLLVAAALALLASRWRSLLITLAAGTVGYLAAGLFW